MFSDLLSLIWTPVIHNICCMICKELVHFILNNIFIEHLHTVQTCTIVTIIVSIIEQFEVITIENLSIYLLCACLLDNGLWVSREFWQTGGFSLLLAFMVLGEFVRLSLKSVNLFQPFSTKYWFDMFCGVWY